MDLGLHGHIAHWHRFIANDALRIDRQHPGSGQVLALATAALVRIAIGVLSSQTHQVQEMPHLVSFGSPAVRQMVDFQRPTQDLHDGFY